MAGEGHGHEVVGLLHHRVVERDPGGRSPGGRLEPEEGEIALRTGQRRAHGARHVGLVALEGRDDRPGREEEEAAVPRVASVCHHRGGGRGVGPLDEATERDGTRRARASFAGSLGELEIAVSLLGPRRAGAEGHEPPCLGCLPPGDDSLAASATAIAWSDGQTSIGAAKAGCRNRHAPKRSSTRNAASGVTASQSR
jgi:hypothetical protein